MMHLNNTKKIRVQLVIGGASSTCVFGSKTNNYQRLSESVARTREYQLIFPSSHSKRVGFLCMTDNPYALFGRLAGVIE